jgi:uracil-DNA glycosylase
MGFFNNNNSLFNNVKTETKHQTGCGKCGAYLNCKHGRLDGVIGSNDILLVLPPPSEREDLSGRCGYGEEYVWLSRQLSDVGICYNDCSRINLTGCYGGKDKHNIQYCRSRVDDFVRLHKPKLVIAFGSDALECTVGT